jgi:hypothetical protein
METTIKNIKVILVALVVVMLASAASAGWFSWQFFRTKEELTEAKTHLADLGTLTGVESYGTAHIHADFKMYVEGKEWNLFKEKNFEKNKFVHFHPTTNPKKPNENVIHVHAGGISLAQFLRTLGVEMTNECLIIEDIKYCENGSKMLKLYVNGEIISDPERYKIKDLDKILISFGNENEAEIKDQLNSIDNNAKTHSTPLNFECGADC